MPTIVHILLGCARITLVALASERSHAAAGIFATSPINIPIILRTL